MVLKNSHIGLVSSVAVPLKIHIGRFPCCGGIEIVATPGHMPGHISIYLEENKTLITGDALVLENGELIGANPQHTLDMATAKKSIKKLLNYEIDRLICYHGSVYEKDVKESLKKFI